ncbi:MULTISPECIES: sulfatase [unclassified Carboxylicivirga]|uniref:sulfatase n=1 Tax=Carboxylicivirga TaxID=1628153 RepID=UPI003D336813
MKKIFVFAVLGLILFMNVGHCRAEKKQKTNVLFIVVDDLKPMLGCYSDQQIISPNMDALAGQGVLFENAYCQQAVCAASRVSVFSGLRPDQTRVWDLKTNMRDVNPGVVTLPQYFQKHGYQTAAAGKIIHGAKNNDPRSWSIPYQEDRHYTYAKGFKYPANGKYQNKVIHKAYRESKKEKLGWKATNQYLKECGLSPSVECLDVPDDAYEDGAVAVKGMELLNEMSQAEQPFFLALGFHKPHLPFAAPKKYWDMYQRSDISQAPFMEKSEGAPVHAYHSWGELRNYSDILPTGQVPADKQKELIHGYKACVTYVDAQIGKVLTKLDELGLRENTVVVLWGDHGWHLGDHGLWCKHSNFEQAVKAPLIISAPGMKQGKVAATMAEFVDMYPTLCELTDLPVGEHLDGLSLVPALKNPKKEVKNYAISQFPRGDKIMGYTIRNQQYRYTIWLQGPFRKQQIYTQPKIVATELYDYINDPLEKTSLADDTQHEAIRVSMQTQLLEILNSQKR